MVSDKNTQQHPVEGSKNPGNENKSDEEIRAVRCRQKLLCELDTFRRFACQEKINDIVIRVQQCSHSAMKEKFHQQTNVWVANQTKFLKEEQEIYHKLHEEEEESRKRQEQMVYEHEQHAKRVNEINKIIIRVEERERENEERNRQLRLHKRMLTEKCHAFVLEYRAIYENFLEHLKLCKDKKAFGDRSAINIANLKSFSDLINHQIPEKCKNLAVNDDDLQTCAKTLEEARSVIEKMGADIETINKEHDQAILKIRQKEEPVPSNPSSVNVIPAQSSELTPKPSELTPNPTELTPKPSELTPNPSELTPKPSMQETQNNETTTSEFSNIVDHFSALREFVNENAYKKYCSLNHFREKFAKSYESLLKDDGLKKFRFECQKAVNTPVNAISPINASHLQDKFSKLQRLLTGQAIESGRSHFSASQHPQGISFCKDLLAKKIVSQGETTVSCKPEAAFAIATVVVSLWLEFPDFGQLLLAHFYKECPYLVPFFKPQLVDQSDVEYYKSLGYRYSETGEIEKQDKFLKRMSGIMHLYCAIIVTPPKRHFIKQHPLGIREAWRWIASIINLDPRPDVCATFLYEFLEVTGHFMYQYYGHVFQKILHLLCTEYYHKLEEVTPSSARGPVARLESFLQNILKEGRINPPTGLLPIGFW